jgi:hypothetical protein
MTGEDSQTESGEGLLVCFDLLEGTSESTRAKTAETFLELLGARVRNRIGEALIGWLAAHFWHFVRHHGRPSFSNLRFGELSISSVRLRPPLSEIQIFRSP